MADLRRMADMRWRRFLVAGSAGIAGIWFAPAAHQPTITLVLSVVALVAMRRGIRAWAGDSSRPWTLLRYGAWLFVVAQLVRAGHGMVIGTPKPFPSPADPIYYVGYALLIAGIVSLVRRRKAQVEGDNLIDALIVVTCLGVFVTAYVLQPYVESIYLDALQKALSVAYTLCDLVLVGVTVRLAVGGGRRNQSYYLLGGAWAMALLADILVTAETMGFLLAPWTYLTSATSYVLLATAALHPSMALLAERPPPQEVRLTRGRLCTLFAAMVLVPGMLAWESAAGSSRTSTYAVGSVVMAVLVLSRLAGLVRAKERKAEREAVLRTAASSFAGTLDADEMLKVAVETLGSMVGAGPNGRATLATVDGDTLRVVAGVGLRARDAIGTVVDVRSVPGMAEAVAAGTWHAAPAHAIDLPDPGPNTAHVLVVPLVSRQSVRGAFVVTVARPVPFEVVGAVGSLADQLSVALEANALADEISRRRHERRFRALVENGSDLVTLVDANGVVFFASPASTHLLGVAEADLVGRHPLDRIHPDDRYLAGSLLDAVWSSAREGEPIEARFGHADGTWRWFEVVADNLIDEPDVAGVVVHFRDITDRKRAELDLQESAARFRSLVQHASDLVVVLDETAQVTYVSPSIMRVLGYLQEEVLHTSGPLLVHPDDLASLPHAWQEPFPPITRELRVRRRNGDWAVVEFTASDLRRERGVEGIVLNGRDVTDRKTLEAELRRLALHDGLTGLPNRTLFLDRVEQALGRESMSPLAVLYVDLDDFKTINDGLGHVAGDALLRAVAGRLSTCVRHQDTAARLGGDEFGILLDGIEDVAAASDIARRVGDALNEPFAIDGRQLQVTATVGLVLTSDEVVDTEALLRRADVAMYLAKTRGKNRLQTYETGMDEQFRERLELKGDLAAALEQKQFAVVYQPIVSLATGELDGFEALVRWQHPTRGMVPPNVFVPIAEETGDIVTLGQWVLRTACEQLAAWHRAYPTIRPRMSVNLSIRQLEHPGLISTVRAAVAAAGIRPGDLTLEITESVLAQDVTLVRGQLAELQDLGVKVAIDDFGTGYSSFGYLSQFSLDVLKIDRSFVMDLDSVDGEQADIVRAIVALARSRGLRTVAEGIEETVQRDVLRELGCDTGQGYLFSRPQSAGDLESVLREAAPAAVAVVPVPAQRHRGSVARSSSGVVA